MELVKIVIERILDQKIELLERIRKDKEGGSFLNERLLKAIKPL